ncbi:MAG TPA: PTS sugar transporter subunit IIB [Anaerolineaceae bacterium]|jgi:PTS system mannose-specific IIB component|nr:PTS sugar transporter subunit IIB [Flavobacteriales bacterium]HOG58902.1 PTS sugar transporter subunit IIB [Anaerolineaceae bacterium]HOR83514.1 PTS sugar transporter subunit IIB [Anaerolineaceae bacterium]HPL42782.1 PTS sugar transporter subunit IIB [Anaerolineaceae bacterium]HPY33770.1 PTS sugar transporter subunit IIB [Anaerolineaceae bacterium]
MKNIVLTRIDDRLIHGQVVAFWMKENPINKILIIDDLLASDNFMSRIYKAAAPSGTEVILLNRAEGQSFLKEENNKDERIFLIVKVPERIEELIDAGIPIKKVVLGGMGANNHRKTFNRNVSASADEIACFKRILEKGTDIVYQMIPSDKPAPIQAFIK